MDAAGVIGDEPAFEIPEDPAGESAEEGREGAGGKYPSMNLNVVRMYLPIHDIRSARAEAA